MKVNLRAMKAQGWKWLGGVYTGRPNLKTSRYLGDLWVRAGETRLASRVEYGYAESFDPIEKSRIERGPSLCTSASCVEQQWIYSEPQQVLA